MRLAFGINHNRGIFVYVLGGGSSGGLEGIEKSYSKWKYGSSCLHFVINCFTRCICDDVATHLLFTPRVTRKIHGSYNTENTFSLILMLNAGVYWLLKILSNRIRIQVHSSHRMSNILGTLVDTLSFLKGSDSKFIYVPVFLQTHSYKKICNLNRPAWLKRFWTW